MKLKPVLALLGIVVIGLALYFFLPRANTAKDTLFTEVGRVSPSHLKDLEGNYFLLHFWAKWCQPCTDEIPVLVQFARGVNARGNKKNLSVLAVSLDNSLDEARQILPNQGADLPPYFILALDVDHQFAEKMGSYQYPETYFIGPTGAILEKWVGAQKWLQSEVFEFFRIKLL